MKYCHCVALFTILFFTCSMASGQRFIERNLILNPLLDTTKAFNGKKVSVAHSFTAFAGIGTYGLIKDSDHEWYQHIGAMMELARFRNNATLVITTHMALVADPHNNINLNPRAVFWEEGLFYMWKPKKIYYKAGYYHRCKHDIDNLLIGEERGLIYASALFEAMTQVDVGQDDLLIALRGDLYTIRQDYRLPKYAHERQPNVNNLIGSIRGNFHYQKIFPVKTLGIFFNGYSMVNLYSQNDGILNRLENLNKANLNYGLTGGIILNGNAQIRLLFNYEYLADTNIGLPRSAHLLSFGIMGVHPFGIR